MLIVVDALQVSTRFSGVGRQVLSIARELHRLPKELELEVRCAADVQLLFEPKLPLTAEVHVLLAAPAASGIDTTSTK